MGLFGITARSTLQQGTPSVVRYDGYISIVWSKLCGCRDRSTCFTFISNKWLCDRSRQRVGEGGREGVIIQPISRQTDSNIEPVAKRRSGKDGPKRGESEERTRWSSPSVSVENSEMPQYLAPIKNLRCPRLGKGQGARRRWPTHVTVSKGWISQGPFISS